MCTVSVVPTRRIPGCLQPRRAARASGRGAADGPPLRTSRRSLARDPISGGTWIGVNDAGLAMAVLNRRPTEPRPARQRDLSRGTIVPRLLRFSTAESAIDAIGDLPLSRFEPFTLVIVQGHVVFSVTSSEPALTSRVQMLTKPLMFTSSSLGDEVADAPRRGLFARLVQASTSPLGGQRAFHRHRWLTGRKSAC